MRGTQSQAILEGIVSLFLKVRGYAVVKSMKRQNEKHRVNQGKIKSSLSGTLIDISN